MKEIALRAGGIPDLGRPVGAGGDQPLGIRREGDSYTLSATAFESLNDAGKIDEHAIMTLATRSHNAALEQAA